MYALSYGIYVAVRCVCFGFARMRIVLLHPACKPLFGGQSFRGRQTHIKATHRLTHPRTHTNVDIGTATDKHFARPKH